MCVTDIMVFNVTMKSREIKTLFGLCTIFGLFVLCVTILWSLSSEVYVKNENCTIISTENILKYGLNNKFPNGIPKIVHYNYIDEKVPFRINALVKECQELNKDVMFIFWRDFTSLQLMRYHFVNYLNMYRSYLSDKVEPLKRSDIIRYFILYKFGGIYMDLDTQCQRPFYEAMELHNCILSQEVPAASRILWKVYYVAMNSFMASVPRHSFFELVINSLTKENGKSVIYATGPLFLTKIYYKYNKINARSKVDFANRTVFLASSDTFSPYLEPYIDSHCTSPVTEWMIMACEDVRNYRREETFKMQHAITVHLFFHQGYDWGKKRIASRENICKENRIHEPSFRRL